MDGLGSVVAEVDPNGNMTCGRAYGVYGSTRSQTGAPTSKHGFVGQLGHPTEDASGLVYMRARWYDPAMGRFLSEDPVKHGGNWFSYADDDPTGVCDRDGRMGSPLPPGRGIPWKDVGTWLKVFGPYYVNRLQMAADNLLVRGVLDSTASSRKFAEALATGLGEEGAAGEAAEVVEKEKEAEGAVGVLGGVTKVVEGLEMKLEVDEAAVEGIWADGVDQP